MGAPRDALNARRLIFVKGEEPESVQLALASKCSLTIGPTPVHRLAQMNTHLSDRATAVADEAYRLPDHAVRTLRETRRHPRRTQFDYLHARYLVRALERALADVPAPVRDVLDVFCGTRPYDDLLPPGAECVGMDISNFAGVADVVTSEFLPFEDESFDLVMCTEAFYYVPGPERGVNEIRRVLRPGGTVIITVSLPWEYDRTILERRFTGPELAALFGGWEGVEVTENGGFAVSWATLTGRIVRGVEEHLPTAAARLGRPLFIAAYVVINALGALLDRIERRQPPRRHILPMNIMLVARRSSNSM
jgi:SAM-dependent methyltransferase